MDCLGAPEFETVQFDLMGRVESEVGVAGEQPLDADPNLLTAKPFTETAMRTQGKCGVGASRPESISVSNPVSPFA